MAVAFLEPGCRIGGVTRTSDNLVTFSVITRANSDTTSVQVQLSLLSDFSYLISGTYTSGITDATNNYQNVATFLGEIPENSVVYWRVVLNGTGGPLTGSGARQSGFFISPPSKNSPRSWSMISIGCTHLQRLSSASTAQPYRAKLLRSLRQFTDSGIIHLGDTIYIESGTNTSPFVPLQVGEWRSIDSTNATTATLDDWRTDHLTNMAHQRILGLGYSLSDLMSEVPVYFIRDDHDVASAVNPVFGSETPGSWQEAARMLGMQVLREFWYDLNKPLIEQESGRSYIRQWDTPEDWHQVDIYPVRFLFIDARSYHLFGKTDNSSKTLIDVLGSDQESWFKNRIDDFAESKRGDTPFLVIVSPIDLDGNHGYRQDGSLAPDNFQLSSFPMNEMLNYIWDAGIADRVVFLTGDTHSTAVSRFDSPRGHPSIYDFCLSHAVGTSGHDQVTGWGGRLLGFDSSGPAPIGGIPVLNISGLFTTNNFIQLQGGVDDSGPYLRLNCFFSWPTQNSELISVPQPIFTKEYRI